MEKIHALVSNSFRIAIVGTLIALFLTSMMVLLPAIFYGFGEKLGTAIIIAEASFVMIYLTFITTCTEEDLTKIKVKKVKDDELWISIVCMLGTISIISKNLGLGLFTIGLGFLVYNLKNPPEKRSRDYKEEKRKFLKTILISCMVSIIGIITLTLQI